MGSRARKFLQILLLIGAIGGIVGCALLGGNDDPVTKNTAIHYEHPGQPYERISVSSADLVWQSKKTGNTIAVNSLCQKYQDVSLKALGENILEGIDNLKIENSQTLTFDGREAERISAQGTTDGIPIAIRLLILKKNGCTYDLAYIARKTSFGSEEEIFEQFLKRFHAP